ncbi:RNA polymerase, subunit L [Pseudoloma neurophilia]|uniref:RNA polymerase, subunit L n=1 Tax=Pseudoloma neurophilia TaxID=146866 RepID=A0A0R0M6Q3_9MICR|nr:RNA polymerase, subunit L [Pseudoloma neurophilia]
MRNSLKFLRYFNFVTPPSAMPSSDVGELDERFLKCSYSTTEINTIHLRIKEEGHTLGNILAERLHQDPRCTFSAYRVPHPLEEAVELKVSAHKDTPVLSLIKETLKKIELDFLKLLNDVKESKAKSAQ